MSQMGMGNGQQHGQATGYPDNNGQWVDSSNFNPSHHPSPMHEYNGFAFAPLPMEPLYPGLPSSRTTHQQLQPLIMPQWPSMLTSQSTYMPPMYPPAPLPVAPVSTPISGSSTGSRPASTPRKTLTDSDRRRMCLYHEEHPTVKQTEIGAMFGVERSTVSKVLRNKDKYLYQDDGSRSPIKKPKGKFPDIERALSNWARNHQRQGLPLSDAMIREKAKFFATTVGSSESHLKLNSNSWLEKFKQKNSLMGTKSRKGSIMEESEGISSPPSNSNTPKDTSPTTPSGLASASPVDLSATQSDEGIKSEDDLTAFASRSRPFHSQSNPSLSSFFADAAQSSLSAGPTSPTSPFFTPDSACGPSPFIPQQAQVPPLASNLQRPRSQTFPALGVEPYVSPPSSEPLTPKFLAATVLESPISEMPPPTTSSMQPPPVPLPSSTVQPPTTIPLHTSMGTPSTGHQHSSPIVPSPLSSSASPPASPSQEDARRALELVMNFFQTTPTGFNVEPQEYMTIGKLMQKLKIQPGRGVAGVAGVGGGGGEGSGGEMPGGMHRILEGEGFGRRVE